jgi:hypothetical protein
MSHEFKDSIKSEVKYCINCGCLLYKNIPSKSISISDFNILRMDPLIQKYRPLSLKINPASIYHFNYIAHRKIGLLKIYEVSKRFELVNTIKFKAIGLMDKLYLKDENYIMVQYIEKIALTCILLSFQFNNYFFEKNSSNILETDFQKDKNNLIMNKIYNPKNRIFECYQYIKHELNDLMYWQMFCLKNLDFNLGEFTAFDYINLFFQLGIVFTKEKFEIYNYYYKCLNLLGIIINNEKICNYNQYVVALSAIYINLNNEKYFDQSIFKYIYKIDFSRKKYKFCVKEIFEIISGFYHLNNFIVYNKSININSKSDFIQIVENILLLFKDSKRKAIMPENF